MVLVIVLLVVWDEVGQLWLVNYQVLVDVGVIFFVVDIVGSVMEMLVDQFCGFIIVINCMGFVVGLGIQLKIICVVLVVGVFCYFFWQFGVNYDVVGKGSGQLVWDEQYDVWILLCVQWVMEWVIVFIGMFISFFFELDFDVVNLFN